MPAPENDFDQAVIANPIDSTRRPSVSGVAIIVSVIPLFFVIAFSLCYTSALHAPAPHHLALIIAGPATSTEEVATAIDRQAPDAFDITRVADGSAASRALARRDAVGALVIDGNNVTTLVAGAGGKLAAAAVQELGATVSGQLGGTETITDVVPSAKGDALGTTLFYLLIACTVGGYLSSTVLAQALPKARTRIALATAAGAGALTPLISYAMLSIFVGGLGATFGAVVAALGVAALYTFTVSVLASLFTKLLGPGAIFAIVLVLLAANFASAGGSSPESLLPGFWQAMHNSWVGSGALEAMRSLLFFDGNHTGRWLAQLGIWAVGAVSLLGLVALAKSRKAVDEAP